MDEFEDTYEFIIAKAKFSNKIKHNENNGDALEKYLNFLKEFGSNEVRLLIDRIEKTGSIELNSQNLPPIPSQRNANEQEGNGVQSKKRTRAEAQIDD